MAQKQTQPDPILAISNSICATRDEQGISVAALSRETGISRATIAKIESGEPCQVEPLSRILGALGLELRAVRIKEKRASPRRSRSGSRSL